MFASPAKCTPSVTKTSLLVHLFGTLWYSFAICHDRKYHDSYLFDGFGGRAQFLTMITFYFTFVANLFSFVVDCIQLATNLLDSVKLTKDGYPKNSFLLISIRDEFMSTWVATLCTFVPLLYWGIVATDIKGIHNDQIEEVTPLFGWFNQSLHTIPLLYAVLAISLVNYEYTSVKKVLLEISFFIVGYISWMAYCAQVNGAWAYDIIEHQNKAEFAIFISLCILILMIMHLITRAISSAVWNEGRRDKILIEMERKRQ